MMNRISSTIVRYTLAQAGGGGGAATTVARSMTSLVSTTTKPMRIDFNFKSSSLLSFSTTAADTLEALNQKMEKIINIEQDLVTLAERSDTKQHAYSNVGLMTAAEMDELFDESKILKRNIRENLTQLKSLVEQVRENSDHLSQDLLETNKDGISYAQALDQKMETILQIEMDFGDLEEHYAVKKEAYSNVGMMTAQEIDALFGTSKLKKKGIHERLEELKSLVEQVRTQEEKGASK